jgi:hypothetical protein
VILLVLAVSIKLDVTTSSGAVGVARYKHLDTSPRLLAVDLSQQLLPGAFEHV